VTGVSEVFTASIIRALMAAISNSETSVSFYETTWRNIIEESHVHTRRRENMKSHAAQERSMLASACTIYSSLPRQPRSAEAVAAPRLFQFVSWYNSGT
jgi:transposase-like protein